MQILKWSFFIVICVALSSCVQKYPELDNAVKFIKGQYQGRVNAGVYSDSLRDKFILFELTDTTRNSYKNDMDFYSSQLMQLAYRALSEEQIRDLKFIEIVFLRDSQPYFRKKILLSELKNQELVKQVKTCDVLPDIIYNNGLTFYLREISEPEFYGSTPDSLRNRNYNVEKEHKHIDSLERVLLSQFKNNFKFKDSCYTFSSYDSKEIKFCRSVSSTDDRSYEYYEVWEKVNEFFVFGVVRYEEGECVVFDSKSGKAFYMGGYPEFTQTRKHVYSRGSNMYEETYIDIRRFEDNKAITLSFKGWDIPEYSFNDSGIRFRLRSIQGCDHPNKYMNLQFVSY